MVPTLTAPSRCSCQEELLDPVKAPRARGRSFPQPETFPVEGVPSRARGRESIPVLVMSSPSALPACARVSRSDVLSRTGLFAPPRVRAGVILQMQVRAFLGFEELLFSPATSPRVRAGVRQLAQICTKRRTEKAPRARGCPKYLRSRALRSSEGPACARAWSTTTKAAELPITSPRARGRGARWGARR